MNQHDQELLDKQLQSVSAAPPNEVTVMLAIVAVFLTGVAIGSFLYASTEQPMQMAFNDTAPAAALPHAALQIRRQ
jgi:hypothetical protein